MKRLSRVFLSYVILVIIYVLLGLLLPPNTPTLQTYHLSVTEYKVLVLLVSIPVMVVWFAAFYGYASLEAYSHIIRKTREGKAFRNIAIGLRWLAWGLPIGSIITALLGGLAHSYPNLVTAAFIIVHYVPLVVSLVAFTYIGAGSRDLLVTTGTQLKLSAIRLVILSFSVIGVLYTYFTIQGVQDSKQSPFYLPLWLVVFTIIMPYLYAWFMGLLASYEIFLYSKGSKGLLYRRALNLLSFGTGLAILTTIVLQYIASDTTHLRKITFNTLFLGVYVLLLIYAAGYGMIALGAKRLKKIEEV